jgi:hypothetical protein
MTVRVCFADGLAYPAREEFLATWETCAPPAEGDVVVLAEDRVFEVDGRVWRGADEVICSVSRFP